MRERRVPFEQPLVPELVLDQIDKIGGAVARPGFPVLDAALRYAEILGEGFLRKAGRGAEFFYCHVSSLSARYKAPGGAGVYASTLYPPSNTIAFQKP